MAVSYVVSASVMVAIIGSAAGCRNAPDNTRMKPNETNVTGGGALRPTADNGLWRRTPNCGDVSMSSNTEQRRPREQVSARLDPKTIAVLDHIAAAERRPRSALVRNVLADYAAWQQRQQADERVST
jgi:hypothetical protein